MNINHIFKNGFGHLIKNKNSKNQMRATVFFQFMLIVSVILTIILVSSTSFYTSMLESMNATNLRSAISALNKIEINDNVDISMIEDIERYNDCTIEIYKKDKSNSYNKLVYAKYAHNIFFTESADYNRYESFHPMVDFKNNSFNEIRTYSDGSSVGILKNDSRKYDYFLVNKVSDDNKHLFVAALRYSIIEQQASSISIAAFILTFSIFVIIGVVSYFYITRVTKPLQMINNETLKMARSNDKSVRIPTRKSRISEVDTMISSINALYESLIITQEELEQRNSILIDELELKDKEKNYYDEFIASTSHELKTPIAIIQGYAEGAKFVANNKDDLYEYCDTIVDECTRMNNLVISMIDLSKFNQSKSTLKLERLSIKDFIANSIYLHSKLFEEKNIEVENLVTDDIYGYADKNKIPFVINNLISNAISYIGDEPRKIRFRFERHDNVYRIYVYNSGKRIADDVIQKLWDSFYRGDSSRNRSEGHFGLGLSIIKSIQDAHSQQCGVQNVFGGVEFWFDILKDIPK